MVQKLLLPLSEAGSLVLRSSRRASSSDSNAFNQQIQSCWTKQCRSCFTVRVVLHAAKSPGAWKGDKTFSLLRLFYLKIHPSLFSKNSPISLIFIIIFVVVVLHVENFFPPTLLYKIIFCRFESYLLIH